MTSTSIVLANTSNRQLGLSNGTSLFSNVRIRTALDFCGPAGKVLIALNHEADVTEFTAGKPSNCYLKFLPETEGALATLGLVLDLIPDVGNIVVVPTNASISEGVEEFIEFMTDARADVGMAVIESNSEELSYIREVDGKVLEIHEKEVVGNLACAGVYFFSSKQLLLECIHWTLLNDVRKNGLLYIAPAMNYCITKGMRVIPFPIKSEGYSRSFEQNG
ncbi:hypothetical protein MCEMRE182_00044 [Candidatus Nanopelagicaceae bacterium]